MLDHSSRNLASDSADSLTDLLRGLRLDGVEYGRCEFRAPWGVQFKAQAAARFHFVGCACWLRQPDGQWTEVKGGDALLLPRGAEHALASSPDAMLGCFADLSAEKVCGNVYDVSGGGGGLPSVLFSGSMRFNIDAMHPLLRMMPEVMRIDTLTTKEPAIPHLLEAMAHEVENGRVGSGGLLARLADVLAALIIRSWVEHGCGDTTGWLAAVRHPDIGKVLVAIHRDPDHPWTVDLLAKVMGASRSAFAERFAAIVGETPARYLAQVRMHQARLWLSRDRMRISDAARRLGYESDAAFSRAFKRLIGKAPSHFRGEGGSAPGP